MNINIHVGTLEALRPDIMFGCRSAALVGRKVLAVPTVGVTNLHYGMLPRYGGCSTIQHAILRGEKRVGVTFHFMSVEFDQGAIIAQGSVAMAGPLRRFALKQDGVRDRYYVYNEKTAHNLYRDAQTLGVNLLKDNFDAALGGTATPQRGDRLYFPASALDFGRDSVMYIKGKSNTEIARHFRAFYFPAKQLPRYTANSKALTLHGPEVCNRQTRSPAYVPV